MEAAGKKTGTAQRRLVLANIFLIIMSVASLSYAFVQRNKAIEQEERAKIASEEAVYQSRKLAKLAKEVIEWKKENALKEARLSSSK